MERSILTYLTSCFPITTQVLFKYSHTFALSLHKHHIQFPSSAGVGAMTWSPLACGIISGKYGNGVPESSRASLKVLSSTSRKRVWGWERGKKAERSSSAAACGFLAQAQSGLGRPGPLSLGRLSWAPGRPLLLAGGQSGIQNLSAQKILWGRGGNAQWPGCTYGGSNP